MHFFQKRKLVASVKTIKNVTFLHAKYYSLCLRKSSLRSSLVEKPTLEMILLSTLKIWQLVVFIGFNTEKSQIESTKNFFDIFMGLYLREDAIY